MPTEAGWIWAHAYPHEPMTSTFIVECEERTWAGLGFDSGTADAALDRLEDIFAAHLDGHRLTAQFPDGTDAHWMNFRTVSNKRWHDGNVVLLDGKRTDVIELMQAQMVTVDMVPDDPGTWMFHCHIDDHMDAGMAALYKVEP